MLNPKYSLPYGGASPCLDGKERCQNSQTQLLLPSSKVEEERERGRDGAKDRGGTEVELGSSSSVT